MIRMPVKSVTLFHDVWEDRGNILNSTFLISWFWRFHTINKLRNINRQLITSSISLNISSGSLIFFFKPSLWKDGKSPCFGTHKVFFFFFSIYFFNLEDTYQLAKMIILEDSGFFPVFSFLFFLNNKDYWDNQTRKQTIQLYNVKLTQGHDKVVVLTLSRTLETSGSFRKTSHAWSSPQWV